jgi:hypothetical protein
MPATIGMGQEHGTYYMEMEAAGVTTTEEKDSFVMIGVRRTCDSESAHENDVYCAAATTAAPDGTKGNSTYVASHWPMHRAPALPSIPSSGVL